MQGFPQVSRTWGDSSNLMWGGEGGGLLKLGGGGGGGGGVGWLESIHERGSGEGGGGLKRC